ncbi:transposase [Streptomyces umbrinus]
MLLLLSGVRALTAGRGVSWDAARACRIPRRPCSTPCFRGRRCRIGRPPYQGDLSDAPWESIEPVLAAWRFERRGRALDFRCPPERDLREALDVILYVGRTAVQWCCLPHDFPARATVYGYSRNGRRNACSPTSTACSGSWCR